VKRYTDAGYNERLFSSGLRKRLHLARFFWLRRKLLQLDCPSARVIELGCFDGKTIEFLPRPPERYVGFDANWEDGLSLALQKWKAHPNYEFRVCATAEEMELGAERFDVAIAMETLEHLPEGVLRPYLAKLAGATDQFMFITVPNEKGVVFFFKYLVKLLFGDVEKHSLAEFIHATLGRTHRIERGQHKGFDHDRLARVVSEYFDVVEISGEPFSRLPAALNFTVGIVGRRKAGPLSPGADRLHPGLGRAGEAQAGGGMRGWATP
jgi:cyclopropane fatty-acyl-phospholipid synthase-like methyltransferase